MGRSRQPSKQVEAIVAVKRIYAELAHIPISRNCTGVAECCHFKLTGRTPFITKGEALVALEGVRASGRKVVPESVGGACPLLKADGKCMIYEHRPFGCRSHFCKMAGGPYAREDVRGFIQRLETIDRELGGEGGVNLPTALAAMPSSG